MQFVPLSEAEDKEANLRFVPIQEPVMEPTPILSPEEPVVAQPPVAPTIAPSVPGVTEMRPYEPSLWQRFLDLVPGDRAKAANELTARRIAKEENIPVEEAYRRMKEAVGVRGVMGTRPSGQPMWNPEGRAPIRAATEAAPYVFEGLLDIPKGMAESALRAYRAGDIDSAVDTGFIDKAITYLGDDSKDIFIPNLPERLGVRKDDPNYQGFMGLGKSLGYSLTTMVASATTGTAATLATGNPLAGVGAGMVTSGTVAYRASKDDFLDRLRDKLNKDSKRVFGQPLTQEAWKKAKDEFDSAATEYGAWEAIPEAISNAIFLKAFAKPVRGAQGNKLAGYMEKAASFAAENLTETATGMGQNAAELKAGLTEDEITIADAFKQQFIQTAITMGVMGGGMKGKELATQFYNEQVLPKIDPATALAKAIKADIDAVAFNPQAIKQEAAAAASGITPRTIEQLARQRPAAPVVRPPPPPVQAPPRIEPTLGEAPPVPETRVEPPLEGRAPVELIPGMPTGEELAELPPEEPPAAPPQPEGVTPVTPAVVVEQPSLDRETQARIQSGVASLDPELRDLWAMTLERKLEKKGALTWQDVPQELNNAVDTLSFAGIKNGLTINPKQTIDLIRGTAPAETVTPVTPAVEAAPEAPTVTFRPTPAAAALPDTPTVAPATTPKTFEPPPVNLEAEGLPTVEVPLAGLRLSKDVPQFKLGATAEGIVEPLGGKFERVGVAPIQVWRRMDGSMEVISGRHRFDLAKRSGETTIPAQIHDEAQGFDRLKAAILDAELNIRDGQGKVKDYVNYFKESGIDRETAESRGLLARATGKRSFTIANQGSDELIAAVRSDQIGDEAAYYVALNAPGDARLQSVGIKAIMDGKSMNTATNMMQAVKALAGENDTTVDMFGFDDSAMREAEEMAKIAAQKQREVQARLSAISGASKNPKLAAEEGIDIRNPEEVKRRIDELRQKKTAWDNWSTNPALVSEIRAARGVAPPPATAPLELTATTPEDLRAQEQQAEEREAAEEKAIADREVDLFQLQPQVAEKEAPPEADLFAGEAAPSAEYQAALEKFRRAGETFRKVQEAYRKQEIGDEDFLAARRVYDRATEELDRATRKERGEPEPEAKREEAAVQEMGAAPATDAQIKNETEFLQETTQNALEAIQEDFMVGDLVRFGNTPGVVIGLEGDYARFRPDGARSPKAYQRVPKKSLTFVSRPDTTSEVSYSKEQDNKFGDEAGQLNADKSNLIRLLGANMYQSSLSDVAIKELLQNAFDAVKGATASVNAEGKKIKPIYKTGNIEITIDKENRTISVKDDARGMTPDIVRKAFFTIAGSDKSDLPPELRSGGLGLAKMGFMLGSETLQLDTVRDGVRVTVNASAADIASDNFKIKKAPAPKNEHGTTVTVKIPENYIDPKTGDPKPIYFPYSLRSVDSFEKPLVGPVELKVTLKGSGGEETSVLPVGINFPQDKYTKFKANFDWGSADIYFSVDRNTGSAYSIKHQVLSSGVYQFSPSFALDKEKIPYDIIVDVKPNVDARHPDYPFENSRERFKGRLEKDVEALTMYLGQIARGYEARDLQESFKGVVSMPRVEAGAEIAGMAEKLKKTFGTQAAAKPAELKPLPKEITVTADSVTDTKTQQILVDVKAKEAEKKKEATFKGEAAPKALDFMIELKQDPKLPVFHNNTNVDFLAIGRPYGEPEKFFAELGTLLVEMKEEMAKSGMYGYEKLAPENLFFAGVSIDKQYGGVHIKVPYKAVFINPFYSFGARTLFGVRQQLLNTMIHEIAHTGSMDHGVAHNTNMVKVEQYLSDEGLLDYYRDALLDILRRHESAFTAMREAYGQSTTRNTAKSLEDYGKDAAAASSRGDRGRVEYAPSALSARGRPEGGAGIPEAKAAGRKGEISGRPGETRGVEEAVQPSFEFDTEITDQVANANPVVAQALSKAEELPKAKKKLPPGRSPELSAAAEQVLKGTMTKEEFDGLVNRYKPIPVYAEPLAPATSEQVYNSLDVLKREKINPQIPAGYQVGLRLDIPAFNRHGVFVVTIHEKRTPSSPGEAIGYTSVASIKNVKFGVGNQKATLQIAAGKAKDAIQTMEGEYVPITPGEAYRRSKEVFEGWVQIGIDPTRHAYFYDRRTTQPVLKADEVIQIGNMILARGVTYGSKSDFLFNIDSGPVEGMKFGQEEIRKQQIQQYANLKAKIARGVKEVVEGEAGIDLQRNLTYAVQAARKLQAEIRATAPRRDSAERFLARALTEYDDGNISADVLAVIQSAYNKNPELLEGLLLSVRTDENKPLTAGSFEAFSRLITLYKGSSGVTSPSTIRHEITHTLEQMMTPEQRMVVVQAWGKALQKAIKQNPDELHQKYFQAVLDFIQNPNERTHRLARRALPSYEMYQLINPSEFWAVNGESLMAAELGGAWDKFKRAVRMLFEGLKNVFGLDNRYAIHKVFGQVMKGNKQRLDRTTLVDLVSSTEGGPFSTLENIEEDENLMKKYSRPHTPMLDTTPLKTFVTRQFKNGKEFFEGAADNPRQAMVGVGDSVMDGLIYLRNKNVWYGAGLEARDFDAYNGQLRTSEGMATASVALDNAIRSGNIGVEVIFRGGIKYDPKSNNFVAEERKLGMKGVYAAEAAIKKRLGDQLGTDIIQGYLEAKRSISIMNELYDREAAYEASKTTLDELKAMGADPDEIAIAKAETQALANDLEAIKKAASSVNMSEDEMQEFASLDERHPELRDLMRNWTAINQNLLRFWRQVGLLSQGRYETLSAIQDYVPWYRIMADEEDVHSPLQSTTRTLANIGREKLFKRGKPIAVVDFRAAEGQKDFKIQPSSVVSVKVNGKPVDPDLVSVTPSGEVHINMDLEANDLVVFETNREIENIIDNMTRNVMRMTMNGIRQFAANRIVLEYASRNANGKIMVFPSVDKDKGRFNWTVNGKKVVVEIQDPLVAASIYGMENINLQMWKPLAMVANLTRRAITLSGVFQIKQVFKDAPTAAIVTGVKNPLALIGGVWKGFLTSLTNTDPVVDILKAAGIGGFHSPARTPEAEIKRRLGIMNRNVFSAVIKGLDHIGDSSDMAQRVATYKRVLAETGDETQALFQAANVINFLHHGSAGYSQAVVKVVPFMGAYANAMDVLVRSLVGGGLKGVSRKKALARLAITASILTSLTLLYAMLAGGDPEYDELDDQTKLKNIIIPGTKIILPMNTSAAFFFKAIPELIYNAVTREGTENEMDRRRIRKALADVARDMLLGPEPVPAGVKPVLEVAINHDFFTGRTVIPEGLKDVAAAEQYTATTSELGKKISEMLSIPGTDDKRVLSPIEADHLVRGVFGTAGAVSQWVSNSIGAIAESRPEPTAREAPITGSFLREEVPRGREDLFYDFKDIVFEKYKTWQKMVEREDYDAADKYLEKNGDIGAMYEYINETEAELKEINAEIRRLGETRAKDQTPKERREEIDEYKRLRMDILEPVKELRREVLK